MTELLAVVAVAAYAVGLVVGIALTLAIVHD